MRLFLLAGSIRRALVAVVMASVLPALGILLLTGLESRRHAEDDARTAALDLAHEIAETQQNTTLDVLQALHVLAMDMRYRRNAVLPLRQLLEQTLSTAPMLSNICTTDRDGQLKDCALPPSDEASSGEAAARLAIANHAFTPGEYARFEDGQPTALTFAACLGTPGQPPEGAVVAYVRLGTYDHYLKNLNLPAGSVVTIADTRGKQACLRSGPSGKEVVSQAAWERASRDSGKGAFLETGMDRVSRFFASVPLRLPPYDSPYMYVLVGIPEDHAMARARFMLRRNLALLSAATAMALFIAWLLWKPTVGGRIDKLVAVTGKLGQGDFTAHIPNPQDKGELGRLEQSVNAMAMALAQSERSRRLYEHALLQASEELDEKVRHRTRQLSEANLQLKSVMIERGRVQLELGKSERMYRSLFEQAAAGILILDNNGIVLQANSTALGLIGSSHEELAGSRYESLIHPESLEATPVNLEALTLGESLQTQRIFLAKDGRAIPVDVAGSRINERMLQIVFTDATERKKLEQLRDDVERITRHDLKTPLMGMVQVPDLLLRDRNLTVKQREFLEMLREAGYRMLRTINMSLALYKMEANTYNCERLDFDMLATALRTAGETQHLGDSKQVRIVVRLDHAPPAPGSRFMVNGEEYLCVTMLENLLKNALEASPENEKVFLEFDTAGRSMTIRNKGEVPAGIRQRFFEKYSTAGKKWGTGLGTYSAKLIAATHGWGIRLDSTVPGETSIVVAFPGPEPNGTAPA